MKLQVIGSHLCPDTLYALNVLKAKEVDFDFVNISASLGDLKKFLQIRENTPEIYDNVRKNNGLGIPCFVKADGEITLDIKKVL